MTFQFRRLILAAVLPVLVMITIQAEAGIIKFDFEGEVTSSASSAISFGDSVTGDFTYDPDAVTSSFPVMPGAAYSFSPDLVINIKIDVFTFTFSSGSDLFVLNDSPGDQLTPFAEGGAGANPPDFTAGEITLSLLGSLDFLLVAGDVLPDDPSQIDVTEITSGSGGINSSLGGETISFDIFTDSVGVRSIPEPATLILISLGLAGIGYRQHRS